MGSLPLVFLVVAVSLSSAMMPGKEEMEMKGDQVDKLSTLKSGLDAKITADRCLGHDITLKKFLRYNDFNVNKATKAMEEAYKWDTDYRDKDGISDADYPAMKEKIGGNTDAKDSEGRPVLYLKVNQWPWWEARKEAGGMEKWKKSFYKMMDDVWCTKTVHIYEGGDSHTRFTVLADYEKWDPLLGADPISLLDIGELTRRFESRWPGTKAHVIIFNTPEQWKVIADLIKPLFSPATTEVLQILGMDKAAWRKELEKAVPDAELKKVGL